MVPIVGPRILKGGKGRASVVCAQSKAPGRELKKRGAHNAFWGNGQCIDRVGNVRNCNNAGQCGAAVLVEKIHHQ